MNTSAMMQLFRYAIPSWAFLRAKECPIRWSRSHPAWGSAGERQRHHFGLRILRHPEDVVASSCGDHELPYSARAVSYVDQLLRSAQGGIRLL